MNLHYLSIFTFDHQLFIFHLINFHLISIFLSSPNKRLLKYVCPSVRPSVRPAFIFGDFNEHLSTAWPVLALFASVCYSFLHSLTRWLFHCSPPLGATDFFRNFSQKEQKKIPRLDFSLKSKSRFCPLFFFWCQCHDSKKFLQIWRNRKKKL